MKTMEELEEEWNEIMRRIELKGDERDIILKNILDELRILNRLLQPIVREIAEMNGKSVEEMMIRTETFRYDPKP